MTAHSIEQALQKPNALVAYLVGNYPNASQFIDYLVEVSQVADVVEVGIPFSDPLADGLTIQRASQIALQQGANLRQIIDAIREHRNVIAAPIVIMSYLNPLLAYGIDALANDARNSGVSGFIVPDLPHEESSAIETTFTDASLALIPLITPITPIDTIEALSANATGFIYAVTRTGVTGGHSTLGEDAKHCLSQARKHARVPVMAGFGVRDARQVEELSHHADGVIVGSALLECIDAGDSPASFLNTLKRPERQGAAQ